MRHFECYDYPFGRGFEDFGQWPHYGPFGHGSFGHGGHFGPREFGCSRGPFEDQGRRHHGPDFGSCGPHDKHCPPGGPGFGDHGPEREAGPCGRRPPGFDYFGHDRRHHRRHSPDTAFGPCGRRPPSPGGFEHGPSRGPFGHHRRPHGPGHSPDRGFGSCGRRPHGDFGGYGPARGPFGHCPRGNDFEFGPSDLGPCRRMRGPPFGRQGPYERPGCHCSGPNDSRHKGGNPETDDSGNEGHRRRHGRNKPCGSKNKDGNEGETVLVQRIVVETTPRCNSV